MRLLPPVSAAATAFKSALPRITHSHPPLPNPPRRRRHTRLSSMADGQVAGGGGDVVGLKPAVEKMRRLLSRDPLGGWQKCWEEAVTPWDLGQPTPILLHLLQTGSIPAGRILVPGCGSGYDVIALAGPERYAIGLNVSDTALSRARELSSRSPTGKHCTFLKEDFFDWNSTELFDVIFDYTFFCAIDPNMRPAWARRMNELLKSDGELITLMYPIDDHVGGPPFKALMADYEAVLCPLGFQPVLIEENELAIGGRKAWRN